MSRASDARQTFLHLINHGYLIAKLQLIEIGGGGGEGIFTKTYLFPFVKYQAWEQKSLCAFSN